MNNTAVRSTSGAKDRILDAAERLFADLGLDATSLRQITALAEVNLAAVNYHFQTKDELVRAVYVRRLRPMNQERLERLTQMEERAGDQPVAIDDLLDAFYAPVLNEAGRLAARGIPMTKLIGRMYTDPHPVVDRVFTDEIAPVAARFQKAFSRTLPDLSARELFWRMYLSVGLLAHALGSSRKVSIISGKLCDGENMEEVLTQVKTYAKAGFLAPSQEKL